MKQGGADGDGASSSSRQRGGGARRERRSGREFERRVQPKCRKEKHPEDGAEGAGHRPRDLGCPRRMREDRGDGGGDGGGKTVRSRDSRWTARRPATRGIIHELQEGHGLMSLQQAQVV